MKKNAILIGILLCVICFLLWWHRSSPDVNATEDNVSAASNAAPETQTKSLGTPKAVQSAKVGKSTSATKDPRTMTPSEFQQWELSIETGPIDFYGKVVDENSNVVAGANVAFGWNTEARGRGHKTTNTQSDADGLFSLHGVRGDILDVAVSKKGYYASRPEADTFPYFGGNHFNPDPLNPVVFHLRKKGEGAPLIQCDFPGFAHIAQLRHDGTPVELDLGKGAQVSSGNGQLKLEFWRDLTNRNANVYDWKLQISAPGGGLAQTSEEFAFQAPESGYEPSIMIDMPSTKQGWRNGLHAKYYLRLPDGSYGRMDIDFQAYNGVFKIHSAINPTGSPNLEPAK